MTRVAVLVVDGLGIGAMPDASALRAGDAAAHTLGHVLTPPAEHRAFPHSAPWGSGCCIRTRAWPSPSPPGRPRDGPPSDTRARTPSAAIRR